MGADFTMAKFPYFAMTDERKESFRKAIAELSDEERNEILDWNCLEYLDDDEVLASVEQACGLTSRETCNDYAYTEKGEKYEVIITGGMSWGDAPTDAYETFSMLGLFDKVWELAVDYAIEDVKMIPADIAEQLQGDV